MSHYIDGFVHPVPAVHLDKYRVVASKVAEIWKEHGALDYFEFVGDDMSLEGTRLFTDAVNAEDDEVVLFGWVVFDSRESRDIANKHVAEDPRMVDLIGPLTTGTRQIFDASRMLYGGFIALDA